jgi:D-glycero-alpha-D-manno-heptose-7-phosphate kinase
MVTLADELRDILNKENVDALGSLLHRGWLHKKELARGISNEHIDALYDKAVEHGASGGKLLGAGGTGFLLFYADNHEALKKHIKCKALSFNVDREGTKIIFYG